jgi:hypothetical protein
MAQYTPFFEKDKAEIPFYSSKSILLIFDIRFLVLNKKIFYNLLIVLYSRFIKQKKNFVYCLNGEKIILIRTAFFRYK